jgi:hypothetical protein
MVTVVAATVQTGVASETKPTASPDEAVALIVNGAAPKLFPRSAAKLMVWLVMALASSEATSEQPWSSAIVAARANVRMPR